MQWTTKGHQQKSEKKGLRYDTAYLEWYKVRLWRDLLLPDSESLYLPLRVRVDQLLYKRSLPPTRKGIATDLSVSFL